ncbi:MAG: hypothetical protein AAFX06_13710 [Planctomycetota bacterium]
MIRSDGIVAAIARQPTPRLLTTEARLLAFGAIGNGVTRCAAERYLCTT